MDGHEIKSYFSITERALFIPRVLVTGMAKRRNARSGAYLEPDDYEREDLLLMQDRKGEYFWALVENLLEPGSNMRLHPCDITHKQANDYIEEGVMIIEDRNTHIPDFSVPSGLSQWGNTPTIDEILERLDLAAGHLPTVWKVHIFVSRPDAKRPCDEVNTAENTSAKAKIKRNLEDTRNMGRFCNRPWNGEGPSNWTSTVCPGSAPHCTTRPPLRPPHNPSRRRSQSTSSSTSSPPNIYTWQAPAPDQKRRRCPTYYILRLALVPKSKLEAHQRANDLARARKHKKPEGYKAPPKPSRWTALVKRVRGFCRDVQRPPCVVAGASRWAIESEDGGDGGGTVRKRMEPREEMLGFVASQRSGSLTLVEEDVISPLRLPGPALEGGRAADWVETGEMRPVKGHSEVAAGAAKAIRRVGKLGTFSKVEGLDGVRGDANALCPETR